MPKNDYRPKWFSLASYRENKKYENRTEYARFDGTRAELKRLKVTGVLECIILPVLVFFQGMMRIMEMQSAMYVLLPYICEVLFILFFVIKTCSLIEHAEVMKIQVYDRTVVSLPALCVCILVCAAVGFVGSIVFIAGHGLGSCGTERVIYMVYKAAVIAAGILSGRNLKKYSWFISE